MLQPLLRRANIPRHVSSGCLYLCASTSKRIRSRPVHQEHRDKSSRWITQRRHSSAMFDQRCIPARTSEWPLNKGGRGGWRLRRERTSSSKPRLICVTQPRFWKQRSRRSSCVYRSVARTQGRSASPTKTVINTRENRGRMRWVIAAAGCLCSFVHSSSACPEKLAVLVAMGWNLGLAPSVLQNSDGTRLNLLWLL